MFPLNPGGRISLDHIRANGRIRAREVLVIVKSDNQKLGVMSLSDALRQAQSRGLDLVEVAPNAKPPVCHIVNLGKFRYQMAKQEKERRQHSGRVKEVKFRVNIDQHDYLTKIRHAEEFLDKGNKVKVQLQFRGREMAHQDLGMKVMLRVQSDLSQMAVAEMAPKQIGRSINMTLAPLPLGKRKRRFTVEGEELEEDVDPEFSDDEAEEESGEAAAN